LIDNSIKFFILLGLLLLNERQQHVDIGSDHQEESISNYPSKQEGSHCQEKTFESELGILP
jgi:hypothetical protein